MTLSTSSPWFWAAWSLALVWQNYSFTRVSRARNSASLKAHAIASLQSNSAWFIQSLFVYSSFMSILTGGSGWLKALGAAMFYTSLTMTGSVYAHYVSLKKEKGNTRVGAHKDVATFTQGEAVKIRELIQTLYGLEAQGFQLPTPKASAAVITKSALSSGNAARWVPESLSGGSSGIAVSNAIAAAPGQGAKL